MDYERQERRRAILGLIACFLFAPFLHLVRCVQVMWHNEARWNKVWSCAPLVLPQPYFQRDACCILRARPNLLVLCGGPIIAFEYMPTDKPHLSDATGPVLKQDL